MLRQALRVKGRHIVHLDLLRCRIIAPQERTDILEKRIRPFGQHKHIPVSAPLRQVRSGDIANITQRPDCGAHFVG